MTVRTFPSVVAILAALLLNACVSTPTKPQDEPQANTHTKTQTAADPSPAKPGGPRMPEIVNFTPFPNIVLTCDGPCSADAGQDFYTWNVKLSFDFDRYGHLKVSKQQEPSLTPKDDPALDLTCSEKGSTRNQRRTWFPHTSIFVRGGKLLSVRDADQTRQKLIPLSTIEGGEMMVIGPAARDDEWSYAPCVGPHRAEAGFRLDDFLPSGAVLAIKSGRRHLTRLSLPSPTEAYALLYYSSGTIIPVPMRPVTITIDAVEHRLIVYYQATFATSPPLNMIELHAILPDQKPAEGEVETDFRERTNALLNDLRNCPVPLKPIEACATPDRHPDQNIFRR